MKKTYLYHVDFLRFLFSVVIVYFHMVGSNIIPFTHGDMAYSVLAKNINYAGNIVACFFIISGVFMYRSYKSQPNLSVFDYILGRIARLWPVLAVALFSESVLSGSSNWSRLILNGLFLQCSGLSLEYKGILWYVSSFFFSSIFYYALLKLSHNERKSLFIVSLLTYFSFVFRINYSNGQIGGRQTVFYVLNLGVLRGIGEIGLGILIAAAFERIEAMCNRAPFAQPTKRCLFVVRGVLECGAVWWLGRYFLLSEKVNNHLLMIIIFSILLFSLLGHHSPLGKVFNRKWLGYAGRFAYSIYVMQQSFFYLFGKTIWLNAELISKPWLVLSVSTLLAVLGSIVIYYLVELPCAKLYRKWYKRVCISRCEEEHCEVEC